MSHSPESILRRFTERRGRAPGLKKYSELHGFLFAVATGPEPVPAFAWMSKGLGDERGSCPNLDDAFDVVTALLAIHRSITEAGDQVALPGDCPFRRPAVTNFEDDAPVALWSRGFLSGHYWLQEPWMARLPLDAARPLGTILLPLGFFASRPWAERVCFQQGCDVEERSAMVVEVFEESMRAYAYFGRTLRGVVPKPEREAVHQHATSAGFYELCRCGSGHPYRGCCGALS